LFVVDTPQGAVEDGQVSFSHTFDGIEHGTSYQNQLNPGYSPPLKFTDGIVVWLYKTYKDYGHNSTQLTGLNNPSTDEYTNRTYLIGAVTQSLSALLRSSVAETEPQVGTRGGTFDINHSFSGYTAAKCTVLRNQHDCNKVSLNKLTGLMDTYNSLERSIVQIVNRYHRPLSLAEKSGEGDDIRWICDVQGVDMVRKGFFQEHDQAGMISIVDTGNTNIPISAEQRKTDKIDIEAKFKELDALVYTKSILLMVAEINQLVATQGKATLESMEDEYCVGELGFTDKLGPGFAKGITFLQTHNASILFTDMNQIVHDRVAEIPVHFCVLQVWNALQVIRCPPPKYGLN
jgi:hypothetical protein